MEDNQPFTDPSSRKADSARVIIPVWVRPFWHWLCWHPLLLVLAGILLAIVWGLVGTKFGAPYLFWAESYWVQFIAAVAATWLLGKLCLVGYLLDSEADWMRPDSHPRSLWWYLKVTWGPLLILGLVPRLLIKAGGSGSFASALNRGHFAGAAWWRGYPGFLLSHLPFFAGIVVGAGSAVLLLIGMRNLQDRYLVSWLLRLPGLRSKLSPQLGQFVDSRRAAFVPRELLEGVPKVVQWHAVAFSFLTLLVLAYFFLMFSKWTYAWITPALALCILLGLVADFYGFIRFHFPKAVYPVMALVILIGVVASSAADKHRFPGLDYSHKESLETSSYESRRRQDCGLLGAQVKDHWLEYFRQHHAVEKEEKPRLVIVAASGGGIRSALWTAVVLNEMEKVSPGFFYHVRLITGASGGMLGAAHFTAKLDELHKFDIRNSFRASGVEDKAHKDMLDQREDCLRRLKIVDNLAKQHSLGPVARYLVLQDIPRTFCPFSYVEDRGWALEEAWHENLLGALDRPIRCLKKGEDEGWRPSLVFAPMLVEDGRRLLISNLDLDSITQAKGSLYTKSQGVHEDLYSMSAFEFFRLFPGANDFKLCTAVRMNASFPFVSPAAALPTNPPRRVVDAGYYDNYGIDVAACWLHENHDWIKQNTSGVLLIQIRDAVSQADRTNLGQEEKGRPRAWWEPGIQEMSTPLEGAYNALMGSMSFRNDEQLRMVSNLFNENGKNDFFTTAVVECPVQAELNWSLTTLESKAIVNSAAEEIDGNLRDLLNAYHPNGAELSRKNRQRMVEMGNLLNSKQR